MTFASGAKHAYRFNVLLFGGLNMRIQTAFFALLANFAIAAGAFAMPVTQADLGEIGDGDVIAGSLAPNEVQWFSFTISPGISYLDITTNISQFDTEIGLYDSLGNLLSSDDDDGFGLNSTLSFGTGSGLVLGDGFNLGGDGIANGEDGMLAGPGLYFLAIGEFETLFGPNFAVSSTGLDAGGDFTITFYTDNVGEIPIPAAFPLFLAGLAGLGFVGRKRRKA